VEKEERRVRPVGGVPTPDPFGERRFIMPATYKWQEVYKAALLETDWSKIEERIRTAEASLHQRKGEFAGNHGGTPEENRAIEDALRGLGVLRNDVNAWSRQQEERGT
jgi:hypothetical protein